MRPEYNDNSESDDGDEDEGEDAEREEQRWERVGAFERDFDEEAAAQQAANPPMDLKELLEVEELPAIYKTASGASSVDIPLAGIHSIHTLVVTVARLGAAMVDEDIRVGVIKIHFALAPGEKPRKVTPSTRLEDMRIATALIITPAK